MNSLKLAVSTALVLCASSMAQAAGLPNPAFVCQDTSSMSGYVITLAENEQGETFVKIAQGTLTNPWPTGGSQGPWDSGPFENQSGDAFPQFLQPSINGKGGGKVVLSSKDIEVKTSKDGEQISVTSVDGVPALFLVLTKNTFSAPGTWAGHLMAELKSETLNIDLSCTRN